MKMVSFEDICSIYKYYTVLFKTDDFVEFEYPNNAESGFELALDRSLTDYLNNQCKKYTSLLVVRECTKVNRNTSYKVFYFHPEKIGKLMCIECYFAEAIQRLNVVFDTYSRYKLGDNKFMYTFDGSTNPKENDWKIANLFYEKIKEMPAYRLFFVTGLWT